VVNGVLALAQRQEPPRQGGHPVDGKRESVDTDHTVDAGLGETGPIEGRLAELGAA